MTPLETAEYYLRVVNKLGFTPRREDIKTLAQMLKHQLEKNEIHPR